MIKDSHNNPYLNIQNNQRQVLMEKKTQTHKYLSTNLQVNKTIKLVVFTLE